ncbi:hypothetical protein AGABI1DRAFT_124762 [Agaricus bisporus var. burnettii JB137-S8]|uniref:Uncharacterized protein n=1 Tax=Agaricus bisporus var. burnettii (strain JB137-S8 / ATCC MYA-4627 / FGSC 10392) TaxID=597362 RepID=K5XFT4_AGABU|nr:uncharacterized protein AGABI1DRAFT_124762 [Agaricus bisporus var. burnettii JB137-S8]EKM82278.1 hypothetical protein AGABI1DRAFT_124762 [Agaricus bisporus var. burnettii JB137-S8]
MTPTAPTAVFYNPDTYLNHLSPQEAFEYETGRNFLLVLLGATIWDILATLPDDIKVLRRCHLRISIFCFIFSRGFALARVMIDVICRIMPIHNIHALVISSTTLCGMSIGCSSYLFLQRVRAVYADCPRVQQFFTFFWIAYLGTNSDIQPLMFFAIATSIAYDSSVFLAISYKIGLAHIVIDREMGWRRFITGKALPRLSQAVLRGGQQYFLLALLVLYPGGIVLYVPFTPPILKSILTVFFAPLMASMSCRIYRDIKLFERDVATPYPISEIVFA